MRNLKSLMVGLFLAVSYVNANSETAESSCVINIKRGWNIISIPAKTDTTVDGLFGHLIRGRIWRVVGQHVEPLAANSILDTKTGYWLYSEIPDIVSLDGGSVVSQFANYRITFDGTWSQATHPEGFPSGAHFSQLIGATHNADVTFWEVGDLATVGIESMAEQGATNALRNEISDAQSNGHTPAAPFDPIITGNGINAPGMASNTLTIHREFSLVTLVSMIAPSPDWFVGVSGLNLIENGQWVDTKTVELEGYDAGTEDGVNFSMSNPASDPLVPISVLQDPPFVVDGNPVPLGTFTFERISDSPTN